MKDRKTQLRRLPVQCLISAVLGPTCVLLWLIPAALLIARGTVPPQQSGALAQAAAALGTIPAGLFLAGRQGRGAVPTGALGGLCAAAALCLLSALCPGSAAEGLWFLRLILCACAGGAFGGALRIRPKKPKKRKHRK